MSIERKPGPDRNRIPLIERFRNAGKEVDATMGDISREMERLFLDQNSNAMRELFEAYVQWEIRGHFNANERPEETRARAMRNFNTTAIAADTEGADQNILIAHAAIQADAAGPITRFVRDAIGFDAPKQPKLH